MGIVELVVGALTGATGIGGIAIAAIKWRERKDVARLDHDKTVSPALLARITTLEQRCDAHHTEMEKLRSAAGECKEALAKCEEREKNLSNLRDEVLRDFVRRDDLTQKVRVVVEEVAADARTSIPPRQR